jgi:hypothetical protein
VSFRAFTLRPDQQTHAQGHACRQHEFLHWRSSSFCLKTKPNAFAVAGESGRNALSAASFREDRRKLIAQRCAMHLGRCVTRAR